MTRARKLLWTVLAATAVGLVACKTVQKKPGLAAPPLPPGFRKDMSASMMSASMAPAKPAPVRAAFEVSPGFRITNATVVTKGQLKLEWQGGTPPFRVEQSSAINGPWLEVGVTSNKTFTGSAGPLSFFRVAYASVPVVTPGSLVWARDIYSSGQAAVNSCAVDSLGNVVVVGYGQGTITFGPGQTVDSGRPAVTWFVAWYNSNGEFLRATVARTGASATSDAECMAIGVAVGADNEPIVVGALRGGLGQADSVNFGDGLDREAIGNNDLMVIKYRTDGTIRWVKQFGTLGVNMLGQGARYATVVLDATGNPVIASAFAQTVNFGNGYTLSSAGGHQNGLLLKLDTSGATQWAAKVNVAELFLLGACLDPIGNIYVCGQYGYYASFTAAGSLRWIKQVSPTTGCDANSVWYDTLTSKLLVVGKSQADADFGGGLRHTLYGGGFFVAAFEPATGNYGGWDLLLGGSGDVAYDVISNPAGKLSMTGVSLNGINYGDGWHYGSGFFLFRTELQASGSPINHSVQRSQGGLSAGYEDAQDTAFFYTGGFFVSSITLGPNNEPLAGHGGRDGFFAKYIR